MKKIIYTQEQFKNGLNDIIRQMTKSFVPELIIAPTRGGLVPGVMLSHYFDVPFAPVNVSFRDHQTDKTQVHLPVDDISRYKSILVIDDILDSGETFAFIKQYLDSVLLKAYSKKVGGNVVKTPTQVKYAAVINNITNQSKFDLDFSYLEVNKVENPDVWIEFPFETWWKN